MKKVQKWEISVDEMKYTVTLENFTAASKQVISVGEETFTLGRSFRALFCGRHETLKVGDEFFPLTVKPFGRAEIYSRRIKIEKIK